MTDSRSALIQLLNTYETEWFSKKNPIEEDRTVVERMRSFIKEHPDCFERSCVPGHMTASGVVVTEDFKSILLTHHRKLGLWLQLGGHCDGNRNPQETALAEAEEESGLRDLTLVDSNLFFDIDIHAIPPWKSDPEHLHYDVRYILVTKTPEAIEISPESNALRWFTVKEAFQVANQRSMHRMFEKIGAFNEMDRHSHYAV